MTLISREMSVSALQKMKKFHEELKDLFDRHDMSLLDNLGRRNILLSGAQEKYFGDELRALYNVSNDGSTGKPDIVVTDTADGLTTEIECKLTTRNKHGGIVFQTDHTSIVKKGKLDYLYVVADSEFEHFSVLYFKDLTSEDFQLPGKGSRGRSIMSKHKAFSKCTVLLGFYGCVNDRRIQELEEKLTGHLSPAKKRNCEKSLEFWKTAPHKYEIDLESV